jgi:nicotinamidase-related amidase
MKSAYGVTVPGDLREICSPDRAAIIVYDMQAAIVPQLADGQSILRGCQQLLAAARANGYRIFYTRHIFLPNATAGVGQFRRAMVWQRKDDPMDTKPLFTATSPASKIVPELTPTEDDVVIEKITMSAFEGTYLDIAFRDANLVAFIIAGIALEVGIEPTIRQGLDLNYIPILVSDLCGAKTEEARLRSLANLRATGEVIETSSSELIALLAQGSKRGDGK